MPMERNTLRCACLRFQWKRCTATKCEGFRNRALLPCAGDLHVLGSRCVASDSLVQGFCNPFAVTVAAQFLLVGGAGYEGNFGQNSGHRAFGEHDESGFFNTAV